MDALHIPAIERQKFPYLQARSLTKEIKVLNTTSLKYILGFIWGREGHSAYQNSVSVLSADRLGYFGLVFRIGKSFRNSQQQKMLPCYKMQ